jgi:hypothetical protein
MGFGQTLIPSPEHLSAFPGSIQGGMTPVARIPDSCVRTLTVAVGQKLRWVTLRVLQILFPRYRKTLGKHIFEHVSVTQHSLSIFEQYKIIVKVVPSYASKSRNSILLYSISRSENLA